MKGNHKYLKRLLTFVLTLAMIITYMPMSMMTAYAATGQEPAHAKIATSNGDGTQQIELSVTGEANTEVETAADVNVLVIFDMSSSMINNRVAPGSGQPRRADAAEKVVYDFDQSFVWLSERQRPDKYRDGDLPCYLNDERVRI